MDSLGQNALLMQLRRQVNRDSLGLPGCRGPDLQLIGKQAIVSIASRRDDDGSSYEQDPVQDLAEPDPSGREIGDQPAELVNSIVENLDVRDPWTDDPEGVAGVEQLGDEQRLQDVGEFLTPSDRSGS
jgi:hypothetical protein